VKKYLLFLLLLFLFGCSVQQTVTNISRLKFQIKSVSDFSLNGINISHKDKLTDYSPTDLLRLAPIFTSGKMPVTFNLNILVKNPNDGTGGYPPTDVTIKSFPWELYINDEKTVSGNIENEIIIPGIGEESIVSIKINVDLIEVFGSDQMNDLLKQALEIGGDKASTSNIKLVAMPVLGTSFGDISYPLPITIVDYEFR